METELNQIQNQEFSRVDEQAMLAEILQNSRQSKNYLKWQLIITVGMVVIPLFAALILVPIILRQVTSIYSVGL